MLTTREHEGFTLLAVCVWTWKSNANRRIPSTKCQRCSECIYDMTALINRSVEQIPQRTVPISHNAPICYRNVDMCAHFGYTMVHGGIFVQGIMGFLRWIYFVSYIILCFMWDLCSVLVIIINDWEHHAMSVLFYSLCTLNRLSG